MPNLRCPLDRNYLNNGHTCIINQLFGENSNRLFYGSKGHRGIDLRTQGQWKYSSYDSDGDGVGWCWKKKERTQDERLGFMPLVAAHSGYLTTNIFYQDRKLGWGMYITWKEDDGTQWRFLNWHIERPWRRIGSAWRGLKLFFKPELIRKGAPIAIAGNTGYSTGPHYHGQLERKVNNKWIAEDPLPHFKDNDILYQYQKPNRWFYKGEEVTLAQAREIISKLPKVCY